MGKINNGQAFNNIIEVDEMLQATEKLLNAFREGGEYYQNGKDCGRYGRNFETAFRFLFYGVFERVHPLGVTDITVKQGVAVECKTGAGELGGNYYTKEEALQALEEGTFRMSRATHVAYLPKYNGHNEQDALILTQKAFLKVLRDNKKIRVKQKTNGFWCIAIQNYIPSPNFKASQAVYEKILSDLFDNGLYIDDFIAKMFIKD